MNDKEAALGPPLKSIKTEIKGVYATSKVALGYGSLSKEIIVIKTNS